MTDRQVRIGRVMHRAGKIAMLEAELSHRAKEAERLSAIEFAAIALKKAKGRYHTEQAANHLFSLLP